MTFDEYQAKASRTINKELSQRDAEQHALHGMASEVGELHSVYQKVFQGHLFDELHAIKEVGDLLWFVAEWCTMMNISMDEVAKINIEKLEARYPEGFREERSLNRDEGDV